MKHDDALPALPIGEAEVLWHEPDPVMPERPGKIIDASHAFMDAAPLGTRLYSAEQMRAYARADRAAHAEPSADERRLRRLLCIARHGRSAYTDDGEASDCSGHPSIDYLRDSLDEIEAKWRLRASATLTAPEPSEAARLYIDGEWNSYRGELLSLALVGEDGSEWYEVIDFDGTPEPWVAANVMPKLRKAPVSLEWMQGSLQRFLDRYPAGVHIVADWPEDIERFCRVLVTGPGQRLDTPPLTMEVVRIDPVSADPHNALADAHALRDALRAAVAARNTNPA